jgi:hypothetical protein
MRRTQRTIIGSNGRRPKQTATIPRATASARDVDGDFTSGEDAEGAIGELKRQAARQQCRGGALTGQRANEINQQGRRQRADGGIRRRSRGLGHDRFHGIAGQISSTISIGWHGR